MYNFSAGPAILPLEVLEQAQAECLNYAGSGMSVMEMSHRSKAFDGIIKAAEADLRQLLAIPDNYKVLFVQGGASTQFAAIPLNFTQEGECVCVLSPQRFRAHKLHETYRHRGVCASSRAVCAHVRLQQQARRRRISTGVWVALRVAGALVEGARQSTRGREGGAADTAARCAWSIAHCAGCATHLLKSHSYSEPTHFKPTHPITHPRTLCLPACTCAGDTVDYIVTGAWSKKAYEEASKFGLNANLVAKGDNKSVPGRDAWKLSPDAKYVHYCDNETIGGGCGCGGACTQEAASDAVSMHAVSMGESNLSRHLPV